MLICARTDSAAQASAKKPKEQPAAETEWRPRYIKGRSYVTAEAVSAYYGFKSVRKQGTTLTLSHPQVTLEGVIGEKRIRLNRLVFYLSFPIVISGGRVYISTFDVSNMLDPILQPNARRDPADLKTVVIDPAAGGVEPGIRTPQGTEKDITLDVARRLKPLLENAGYMVVLTRDEDVAVFSSERIRMANQVQEECIYISLRVNQAGKEPRGFECSTLPPASTPATFEPDTEDLPKNFFPGNINDRESMALATTIHSNVIATAKAPDLGIKRQRFEELRGIEQPSVVCRLGFLTNKEEGKKLASGEYRQLLAEGITKGVNSYAGFLRKGSEARTEENKKRALFFATPRITVDAPAAGLAGEQATIQLGITAARETTVDRSKLEIQLFVFEKIDSADIDLTISDKPKIEWLSVLPDWKATPTEWLQAVYKRPQLTAAEARKFGRRRYYGFIARLIYDGKTLDEISEPHNLKRCLYYFMPVFPRR